MGEPRYDAASNRMVRTDDQADVQNIRTRFTAAQVNAGAAFLPAVPGFAYRFLDFMLIAIGGAVTGATDVRVLGTQAAGAVALLVGVAAALTEGAVVRAGATNANVLAGGLSFTPLDANTAVTVGKTGGTLATATHVDVIANYVLEAA